MGCNRCDIDFGRGADIVQCRHVGNHLKLKESHAGTNLLTVPTERDNEPLVGRPRLDTVRATGNCTPRRRIVSAKIQADGEDGLSGQQLVSLMIVDWYCR